VREHEEGLLGLVPLTRIKGVDEGSPNRGLLREGDVLVRVGPLVGPRLMELKRAVAARTGESIAITVERDGALVEVEAAVSRQGRVGITLAYALDLPVIAQPMSRIARKATAGESPDIVSTAVAALNLMPRTRIDAVDGAAVEDWASLRQHLRASTAEAAARGAGATVELTITHPTPGRETATLPLELSAAHVEELHQLSWSSELPLYAFDPIYTTLSAGGNPIKAIGMGVERTHSIIMLTYVTIDRLFRGTVGVEQLRGPVGIVHLGVQIIDKGFMYFIFLMGMISVNLAVINFLPLPIVDGGLFLYLVYEKIKGRPPSLQFQNVATIVGLCLIGTIFLVTFYNDIARLIG
jgi:regulator of sigma E protease